MFACISVRQPLKNIYCYICDEFRFSSDENWTKEAQEREHVILLLSKYSEDKVSIVLDIFSLHKII